jgi:hypothetical protein
MLKSVSCVLSVKVTSSRAVSAVETTSLRKTEEFSPSARVAPSRVPLASPWMRLTAPIASRAAHWPLANPETSITITMISRCNMYEDIRACCAGLVGAARSLSSGRPLRPDPLAPLPTLQ